MKIQQLTKTLIVLVTLSSLVNCSLNKKIVLRSDYCEVHEPLDRHLPKDVVAEWERVDTSINCKEQVDYNKTYSCRHLTGSALTANEKFIKALLENISKNDKKYELKHCTYVN